MERALEQSLASKPFVKGILCVDSNGLLISAKGELNGKQAGKFAAISKEAAALSPEQQPPTVLIETLNRNIMVKDYDNMTIVINCARNEA